MMLILNFKPTFSVKEICRIIAHPVTIWLCTTFTQDIQDHTRFLLLCYFIPLTCSVLLVLERPQSRRTDHLPTL